MKPISLHPDEPRLADVAAALQRAAQDALPFAVACLRDSLRAEALTLETLLIALENGWISFSVAEDAEFTHREFREDIFHLIWRRSLEDLAAGKNTPNLAYTETSMPFYQLDLEERAALALRMKSKFDYPAIARILDGDADQCEAWVDAARKQILGRELSERSEDDGGGHSNA